MFGIWRVGRRSKLICRRHPRNRKSGPTAVIQRRICSGMGLRIASGLKSNQGVGMSGRQQHVTASRMGHRAPTALPSRSHRAPIALLLRLLRLCSLAHRQPEKPH
jgi:hypothetical protein